MSELNSVDEDIDDAHAFAVLNLRRILASFERHDPVMSKLDGGM